MKYFRLTFGAIVNVATAPFLMILLLMAMTSENTAIRPFTVAMVAIASNIHLLIVHRLAFGRWSNDDTHKEKATKEK